MIWVGDLGVPHKGFSENHFGVPLNGGPGKSSCLAGRATRGSDQPAGVSERLANNGHQFGHQRSNTGEGRAGSARMEVPILSDQTALPRTDEDRTKRGKANFKTGALNHSATLPTPTRNAAQCPSAQAISAKLIISPGSLLCGPAAKPANTSQLGGRIWSAQSLGPVE